MISQQQNNMHWPEEETPSLEQEHAAVPPSSWRGWSRWLRILGVVIALVASFALAFPSAFPLEVFLLVLLLLGVLCAGLLRSWWAMLIIPVAFSVGFFLSNIFQMGGFDLQQWAASNFEGLDILVFFMVPIAIGVAIGTPIGKKIEQRLLP